MAYSTGPLSAISRSFPATSVKLGLFEAVLSVHFFSESRYRARVALETGCGPGRSLGPGTDAKGRLSEWRPYLAKLKREELYTTGMKHFCDIELILISLFRRCLNYFLR